MFHYDSALPLTEEIGNYENFISYIESELFSEVVLFEKILDLLIELETEDIYNGTKTVGNVRWVVLFSYFLAEPGWGGQAGLPDTVSHGSRDLQSVRNQDYMGEQCCCF